MKRRYYFTYQQNNVSLSSLTSRIKKEHIPLPLVSVLEVIGLKLTIKLLKTYQGKRFYIPVRNCDRSKLNEVLPQDAVRELSSAMGGMRIDLRHTSIKGVYDTVYFESLKQKHKESKLSINDFCKAYNLTLSDRKRNKLAN